MNYNEFKNTYKWSVKKYPWTLNLFGNGKDFENDVFAEEVVERFEKRGSRWIKVNEKTACIPLRYYMNAIDAIPFFRAIGGVERVATQYTKMGLIPYKVTSISPGGTDKVVRTYFFKYF